MDRSDITRAQAEVAVRTLLFWLGEDPDRPGLIETPARVVSALEELTIGLAGPDPSEYLQKQFELSNSGGMVVIRDIEFTSICEHHLLTFQGKCHIGYLPNKDKDGKYRVAGLSKFPRVVESFARRPQLQEQLTAQIAGCISEGLRTEDVIVMIKSSHSCMSVRGVEARGAETVTSTVRGRFYSNEDGVKTEFLNMLTL